MSVGRHTGDSRVARRARVQMMRRRRRTALVSLLLLVTMGWAWHAAQASPDPKRQTSLSSIQARATLITPTPAPSSSASPSPTAAPARPSPSAVSRPTGRLLVVPGAGPVYGSGPLQRYIVEVEQGLAEDPQAFASAVERTLGDRRSWARGSAMSFQRVSSGSVAFRVVLASPPTVDRYCAPLNTNSYTSCFMGGRAVVNLTRWHRAVPWYADDLATYRQYVINHEVGHALGRGHVDCPRRGALAPVMQQQTLGMQGCARNAWPYP